MEKDKIATVVQRLEERAATRGWQVQFVEKIQSRHSVMHVYQLGPAGGGERVIIKHLVKGESRRGPGGVVNREFTFLKEMRDRLGSPLNGTLPEPLMVFPDEGTLVMRQLPGIPLTAVLKRDANRITGWMRCGGMRLIAHRVGQWLSEFHRSTARNEMRFDGHSFLASLAAALVRWPAEVTGGSEKKEVLSWATRICLEHEGEPLRVAARHGDFIPQNILVHRDGLGIVDLENFDACRPIYEDLGVFLAYLNLLEAIPVYSRRVLREMANSFVQGYSGVFSKEILDLYVLLGMATVVGEFRPVGLFAKRVIRTFLLRRHLARRCRSFVRKTVRNTKETGGPISEKVFRLKGHR